MLSQRDFYSWGVGWIPTGSTEWFRSLIGLKQITFNDWDKDSNSFGTTNIFELILEHKDQTDLLL